MKTVETDTTIAHLCKQCRKTTMVKVVFADVLKWQGGESIQDVLWYLTPDEREIMISGVCGKCFDKMFPPDE